MMKKIVAVLVAGILFIGILSGRFSAHRASAQSLQSRPITGSFVMMDHFVTSQADWETSLQGMKDVGITTVIPIALGIVERTPCEASGNLTTRSALDDQMKNFLRAAHAKEMGVFLGTASGRCEVKFDQGSVDDPSSPAGLLVQYSMQTMKEVEQFFAAEGWSLNDSSFIKGIFIPQEMGIDEVLNNNAKTAYVSTVASKLKSAYPNLPILYSPWMVQNADYNMSRDAFRKMYNMQIDILAPTDGLGTAAVNDIETNKMHFRALRDVRMEYPSKQAWANIESFTNTEENGVTYSPTTIEKLQNQINAAFYCDSANTPCVSNAITWIYQHTMENTPVFDTQASWTNNYTPRKAVQRATLHNRYFDMYVEGYNRIQSVFPWDTNLVVKGTNLGAVGAQITVDITYLGSNDAVQRARKTGIIQQEQNEQALYIPQSELPLFSKDNPVTALVVAGTAEPPARDPDLNNDGTVNIFDYNAFLPPFNEKNVSIADINNDGSVTIEDLNTLLRAFTL